MKGLGRRLLLLGSCLLASGLALAAFTGGVFSVPFVAMTNGGWEILPIGGQTRVASVIGLQGGADMTGGSFRVVSGMSAASRPAALDLGQAHAYPVPFKPRAGHQSITFTRLMPRSTVRVYTLSGELVKELVKDDPTDQLIWNPVANYLGQALASGVYIYHVESSDGSRKTGKLMVIK